jgi:hypothetical protein
MNFTIETTDVPASTNGRPSEPNLFAPEDSENLFLTNWDKEQAMVIRLDGSQESNKGQVTKLTGQARRAAQQAKRDAQGTEGEDGYKPAVDGLTARVKVTEETVGTGKRAKPVTVFTTWARPKITRPRTQGTSQEAAASAANPNTATE